MKGVNSNYTQKGNYDLHFMVHLLNSLIELFAVHLKKYPWQRSKQKFKQKFLKVNLSTSTIG